MTDLTNETSAGLGLRFQGSLLIGWLMRAARSLPRSAAREIDGADAIERVLRAKDYREEARRRVDRLLLR